LEAAAATQAAKEWAEGGAGSRGIAEGVEAGGCTPLAGGGAWVLDSGGGGGWGDGGDGEDVRAEDMADEVEAAAEEEAIPSV